MQKASLLIASWAIAIKNTLDSKGYDSQKLFRQSGIDVNQIYQPGASIPTEVMSKLWELCVAETGNPYFGLEVGKNAYPAMLSGLGIACMLSSSVRAAIQFIVTHSEVISTAAIIEMQKGPHSTDVIFVNHPHHAKISAESFDAFMANMVIFPEKFMGASPEILGAGFVRPAPADQRPYTELFGPNLEFDARHNSLTFSNAFLDGPTSNREQQILDLVSSSILPKLSLIQSMSFKQKVFNQIMSLIGKTDINQTSIASSLNMSVSNLQRKLHLEESNFQTLLDDARKQIASSLLVEDNYSVKKVSAILGFKNASNFSRAFKKWYGVSPTDYKTTPASRTH